MIQAHELLVTVSKQFSPVGWGPIYMMDLKVGGLMEDRERWRAGTKLECVMADIQQRIQSVLTNMPEIIFCQLRTVTGATQEDRQRGKTVEWEEEELNQLRSRIRSLVAVE